VRAVLKAGKWVFPGENEVAVRTASTAADENQRPKGTE
jgi:hypothetical protein